MNILTCLIALVEKGKMNQTQTDQWNFSEELANYPGIKNGQALVGKGEGSRQYVTILHEIKFVLNEIYDEDQDVAVEELRLVYERIKNEVRMNKRAFVSS